MKSDPRTDSVAAFISELIRAANEINRLIQPDRARLLERAAATIRDYRYELNFSGTPANDSGEGDVVDDLMSMAAAIELFSAKEVSATLLDAVELIKACRILLEAKDEVERETGGSG